MTNSLPQKLLVELGQFSDTEKAKIQEAYLFARDKHQGQKRKSGSPYIFHPVRIATNLARDHYDAEAIQAALLHDTLEDTPTTYDELKNHFGETVARLVDGVTKIGSLRTKTKSLSMSDEQRFLSQVDNYRKILLASSNDIRVMIIRLYDRLDNVSDLQSIAPEKRKFYARETIEIYAQIAERLSMSQIQRELEDYSFPYAYPEEYQSFILATRDAYKNPEHVIRREIPVIEHALQEANIPYRSIGGRAKHLFSLYNKMGRGKSLKTIYDIIGLRVIVETVDDCYKCLGLIHKLYQPLPGQIDDYIARPKRGMYQSLHTKVKNDRGNIFEVQIRTQEMHEVNEHGIAAHWSYKDSSTVKNTKVALKNKLEWLDELQKIRDITDNKELITQLKEEFFSKQVFVFTPKGDIVKLPVGSCGLDFAYQIHSRIGHSCVGVRINDRLVPLQTPLQNGDVVEIITSNKAAPTLDWLEYVKTSAARHHIRTYLRQKNFDFLSRTGQLLFEELTQKHHLVMPEKAKVNQMVADSLLPYKDLDSAYVAIAEGVLNRSRLLKIIFPGFDTTEKRKTPVRKPEEQGINSLKNIRYGFAGCCKAKPADPHLIGYVGKDHTIKIHKTSCQRLKNVDERRLIEIS